MHPKKERKPAQNLARARMIVLVPGAAVPNRKRSRLSFIERPQITRLKPGDGGWDANPSIARSSRWLTPGYGASVHPIGMATLGGLAW